MERRKFIAILGGAATWPLMARSQPSSSPVVGLIGARSLASDAHLIAALREGLAETGFVEGRNLRLELRWAEGDYSRVPTLAKSLIALNPAVIMATGTAGAVRSVRIAMPETPMVFSIGADPVAAGLVPALNRPGTNLTGVSSNTTALLGKQMELLCECIPQNSVVAALVNDANPSTTNSRLELEASAARIGRKLIFTSAGIQEDLESAFETLHGGKVGGLIVESDAFFTDRRQRIVNLAAQNGGPAIDTSPEFVEVGGLMSYGANRLDIYRRAGVYVGRILKGERAGDLPVQFPTKFQLVVNLTTARTLGLTIPESFLLRADEVIE